MPVESPSLQVSINSNQDEIFPRNSNFRFDGDHFIEHGCGSGMRQRRLSCKFEKYFLSVRSQQCLLKFDFEYFKLNTLKFLFSGCKGKKCYFNNAPSGFCA